jgi:hypothetical protein
MKKWCDLLLSIPDAYDGVVESVRLVKVGVSSERKTHPASKTNYMCVCVCVCVCVCMRVCACVCACVCA